MSKKLPVGRYYYKETKVPHGYVADTEKHYFEVEDNQVNEIQIIESTLKNERPVVDIDMTKLSEERKYLKILMPIKISYLEFMQENTSTITKAM